MSLAVLGRLTQKYRRVEGLEFKEPPAELEMLERQISELKAKIERMKAEGKPEDEIAPLYGELGELEARYRELLRVWRL
jgi:predicted RNase H-like nuclease (RuvC/YqgF family)